MVAGRAGQSSPSPRVYATVLLAAILSLSTVLLGAAPAFASYSPGVLPVLWYTCDQASGSLTDSAGGYTLPVGGVSGSLPNNPSGGAVAGTNHSCSAPSSNSHNSAWGCPDGSSCAGPSLPATRSFDFWFKSNSGGAQVGALGLHGGCGDEGVGIGVGTGGPDLYITDCGTGQHCGFTSTFATDGAWHFYAVAVAGSTATMYADAVSICTAPTSNTALTGVICVRAGALCGSGWPYGNLNDAHWWLAEVAAFPYTLSATDVANAFGSGAPATPNAMSVSPNAIGLQAGRSALFQFTSTDTTGAPTAGDPYTFTGTTPVGGLTCTVFSSIKDLCTAGSTLGRYTATWHDVHGNSGSATIAIQGLTTSFTVVPASCSISITGTCTFRSLATDASGTDVSQSDGWGFGTLPANVGCLMGLDASGSMVGRCNATAAGNYTIPWSDSQGLTSNTNMAVATLANPQSCGLTDVSCWVGNLIGAVTDIPTQILGGLYNFFFVSQSGKNYLDTSALTAGGFVPSVDCRAGQTPTAPDAIHCLPFPFSIPYDAQDVLNLLAVTPVAPTFTLTWDFHFLGTTIHTSVPFDVGSLLTPTIMGYVRAAELVIFILGTSFATYRFVEMVGAA